MNVVRVEKNKNYSIISNEFLRDKELSYKAKGLLANIMTHSEQYEFSINGIVATSKEEKTAIYGIIKELIESGYATKQQIRTNGEFAKVIYTFFERKNGVFDTNEPLSGFPETGLPDTENQPQRSTNPKEKTNIRNTNCDFASPLDFVIPDFDDDGIFPNQYSLAGKPKIVLPPPVASERQTQSDLRLWKKLRFDEFWEAYKKKKSKDKCLAVWMKLSKEEIDTILLCVTDHVIITPDIQFRKHPITWLNQKCWEDDISYELKRFKPRSYQISTTSSNDDNSWN